MNDCQYIHKFHIFGYDTDWQCNLTPARLVSMMHETAWAHVNKMHVGWSDLQKENLFWVITKVSISIRKLPKWNDEIEIKTTAVKQKMIISLYYHSLHAASAQENRRGAKSPSALSSV